MYPVVEVIAHHIPSSPPKPLRVRFSNEKGEVVVMQVEKVTDLKMERIMGNRMYVYRVRIIQDKTEKIIGLKYEVDTMLWYLTP